MCGIYGSSNLSNFEVLGDANKERGNFSTGIFYKFRNSTYKIIKKQGTKRWREFKLPAGDDGDFLYLGHNQAPTSSKREWDYETSHPFIFGDWIVAHNGVLTNTQQLIDDYIPGHFNEVDTSVIPAMLDEIEYNFGPCEDPESEQQNILTVLERLKGTFALWIINIKTMNVYVARQGSTLFHKGSNISSIKGKGYKEVSEGILYSYTTEGLVAVDGFVSNSPFLTL